MKIFQTTHTFDHPWQQVTMAQWRKYPNDYSAQVVHVDVLDRYCDAEGALHTERLIACQQPIPAFVRQLFGSDSVFYFLEKSTVDARTKVYRSHTQNITYNELISLEERLRYTPVDGGQQATVLDQEASVEAAVGGFQRIRNYIEDFCVKSCQSNAENGRFGLEQVITEVSNDSKNGPA